MRLGRKLRRKKMPDIVSDRLNSVEEDETIEVEVSDREQEFSKVTDILTDIRDRFLGNDTMSFEDAILEIQKELTKLAPVKEAPPTMPPMEAMVPGGMGGISGLPVPPTRM